MTETDALFGRGDHGDEAIQSAETIKFDTLPVAKTKERVISTTISFDSEAEADAFMEEMGIRKAHDGQYWWPEAPGGVMAMDLGDA